MIKKIPALDCAGILLYDAEKLSESVVTYEGYIDRWIELGLCIEGERHIDTPLVSLPKKEVSCVALPSARLPGRVTLPKMQLLPFVDICLLGV